MTKRYIKPRKPGEKCEFAKLTDRSVISIRGRYKRGVSVKELAQEYHVSTRTIYRVLRGETWSHIDDV